MLNTQGVTPTLPKTVGEWLPIVTAEYRESPGLQLTRQQFQRMWGLDEAQCYAVLAMLLEARFLRLKPDGRYIRTDALRI